MGTADGGVWAVGGGGDAFDSCLEIVKGANFIVATEGTDDEDVDEGEGRCEGGREPAGEACVVEVARLVEPGLFTPGQGVLLRPANRSDGFTRPCSKWEPAGFSGEFIDVSGGVCVNISDQLVE